MSNSTLNIIIDPSIPIPILIYGYTWSYYCSEYREHSYHCTTCPEYGIISMSTRHQVWSIECGYTSLNRIDWKLSLFIKLIILQYFYKVFRFNLVLIFHILIINDLIESIFIKILFTLLLLLPYHSDYSQSVLILWWW